jgi:hypothetical protein
LDNESERFGQYRKDLERKDLYKRLNREDSERYERERGERDRLSGLREREKGQYDPVIRPLSLDSAVGLGLGLGLGGTF